MNYYRARQLRRAMTDAERRLWTALRGRRLEGLKFRRQYPFDCYVLDFACVEHRVAVEADGGQHVESRRDENRDAMLGRHGWRLLRFSNSDILTNLDGVAAEIMRVARRR